MKFVDRTQSQIDLGLVPLVSVSQRERIIELELQLDEEIEKMEDEGDRYMEGSNVDLVIKAIYDVLGYFGELKTYLDIKKGEELTEKKVIDKIETDLLLDYLDIWNGSSIISCLEKKLKKFKK
jgi:hypothetical protein